jgi:hypothetical protein
MLAWASVSCKAQAITLLLSDSEKGAQRHGRCGVVLGKLREPLHWISYPRNIQLGAIRLAAYHAARPFCTAFAATDARQWHLVLLEVYETFAKGTATGLVE